MRFLLGGVVAVGLFLPATAAQADPSPAEVERQIDQAHEQLEDVIENYNRIGEELKATQAAIDQLNQQMAPMLGQLDVAQADVAQIAAQAYKSGGGLATAGYLLNSGSSNSMVHQVESMNRVARGRQREINTFAEAKSKYDAEKKRLDDLKAAQTQQQKEASDRKAQIETELKRLEELERKVGTPTNTANTNAPPPPSGSGKGAIAVRFAINQLGKMYEYGAAGPNRFDCSGLTQQAWRSAGIGLPHNAAMQHRQTRSVSRSALIPGDLVFYRGDGHVAIYIGNNQIIHASRTGRPVAVASITSSGTPNGYTRPG